MLGFAAVMLGHDTNLLRKLTGRRLPVNQDPLHRVREWSDVARVVGEARQELLAEGKPVFIIGDHYGLVGEISFYLPEAKASGDEGAAGVLPSHPYSRSTNSTSGPATRIAKARMPSSSASWIVTRPKPSRCRRWSWSGSSNR